MAELPTITERWLASVSYLGPLCLIAMFQKRRTPFVTWHAQQGFCLFFAEAIALAVLIVVENTVGQIWGLGFVIRVFLELVTFVTFLVLITVGFVKALAGESFRMPVIAEYAHRVPLEER